MNITKGELMKETYSESELKNIDVSLPIEVYKRLDGESYFYVMNYNNQSVFGKLEDMREVQLKRSM